MTTPDPRAIPESTVAAVVNEVSGHMKNPQYAELAVGDFVTAHPDAGRFISAHVHGVKLDAPQTPYTGMSLPIKPSGPPAGRGAAAPGIAMGQDDVDWPKVFEAMKIGGVKNYFIEQEQANGWDAMVKGAAYLKTLTV